jgi:hypothetical protein
MSSERNERIGCLSVGLLVVLAVSGCCLQPSAPPVLFVASSAPARVTSYANPGALNGNVAPTTDLSGNNTGFMATRDVAINGAGQLLVCDHDANAVYVYDNLSTRSGTAAPDRTIQGTKTGLGSPVGLFLLER